MISSPGIAAWYEIEGQLGRYCLHNIGQKSCDFWEFCKRCEEIKFTRKARWRRPKTPHFLGASSRFLAGLQSYAAFSNLQYLHSRRVFASSDLGIVSSFLNLTREQKKSGSAILSQKMALKKANWMQGVWNISTFHTVTGKRRPIWYSRLERLWKGAEPIFGLSWVPNFLKTTPLWLK